MQVQFSLHIQLIPQGYPVGSLRIYNNVVFKHSEFFTRNYHHYTLENEFHSFSAHPHTTNSFLSQELVIYFQSEGTRSEFWIKPSKCVLSHDVGITIFVWNNQLYWFQSIAFVFMWFTLITTRVPTFLQPPPPL